MTSDFTKAVSKIDKKLQGRILAAISQIASAPVSPVGDTVKSLTGEMRGMWRYRIGDYRIIYRPDQTSKHILLLIFAASGSTYE
jgi:addiction module RelE/StbE family toxin